MTAPSLPDCIPTARRTHAHRCWRQRRHNQLRRNRHRDQLLYNRILNVFTFIVLGILLAVLAFS